MEQSNETQSNDKLLFVKATSVGEDSKGRQKIDLRFSEEETVALKEELSKIEGRAKLQIHVGEGQYGPSAFLFVKTVQEKADGARSGGGFKKSSAPSSVTTDKIAALKKK